jgi:outer membrane protein assembly factor BamB
MRTRTILALCGVFLAIFGVVAVIYSSGVENSDPVVDHQTSGDLGVRGAVEVSGIRGIEDVVPDIEQDVLQLVMAQGSVVAVTPQGAVGIDPRSGSERWSYQVSDSEVAVGFPAGAESVLVMYKKGGIFQDRINEVVLSPETGEVEYGSTFADPGASVDMQELVDLGFTDTRIMVKDQVAGYDRAGEGEELWSVDPSEYCGEGEISREDFDVASGSYHVYISVLCAADSEMHLVALNPRQGDVEWWQNFSAEGRESPSQIDIVSYGSHAHPVARALSGELGSDYLYVDDRAGSIVTPRLYELESMSGRFPDPSDAQEQAPGTLVIGSQERIDMLATYLAANMLEERGDISIDDFDEGVLSREEDGSMRLTDDLVVLSSLHARNLILETLAQA